MLSNNHVNDYQSPARSGTFGATSSLNSRMATSRPSSRALYRNSTVGAWRLSRRRLHHHLPSRWVLPPALQGRRPGEGRRPGVPPKAILRHGRSSATPCSRVARPEDHQPERGHNVAVWFLHSSWPSTTMVILTSLRTSGTASPSARRPPWGL